MYGEKEKYMPCSDSSSTYKAFPPAVYVFSEPETRDPELVTLVRAGIYYVIQIEKLTPLGMRDFLIDTLRDLETPILDRFGNPTDLDMRWLDCPDFLAEYDNDNFEEEKTRTYEDTLRSYFRHTFFEPMRRNARPVVHEDRRRSFIVVATIIAAAYPGISLHWPRHPVAANDNGGLGRRFRR